MKYLNLYEEFTKDEFEYLVSNDKTYLRNFTKYVKDLNNSDIKDKIKNYIFKDFKINYDGFEMIIYPDENFINLLKQLNNKINIPEFSLSIDRSRLNSINLDFNLPKEFRGLFIGYKIYKLAINKFDYITSDYGLSEFASGVWSKLMLDDELYVYTSGSKNKLRGCSGVIKKNILDKKLNEILNKIKKEIYNIYGINFNELIFDNKIKNKIWK